MMKRNQIFMLAAAIVILFTQCKKEPVAMFEMSQNNVKAPVQISFTNTSSDANEFTWDFGDNSSSSSKDPIHRYETWGNMDVTLTAKGDGGTSSVTKSLVLLPPDPIADFQMSKIRAMVNESVSFTNLSSYAESYNWDFGDGNTSTDENPVHAFSEPGDYSITLIITGAGGNAPVTKNLECYVPQPEANFTIGKEFYMVNETIGLTNLSENSDSYSWDFGDGTYSVEATPNHQYTTAGIFTITLSATGVGGEDSYSQTVFVNSENGLGDPCNDLSNWSFSYCTASIVSGKMKLVPTSSSYMGSAEHDFASMREIPWSLSTEVELSANTDDDLYGILVPLQSSNATAMFVVLFIDGDEYNWGVLFYLPNYDGWGVWDDTGRGNSTAVKTGIGQTNKIEFYMHDDERFTIKCNGAKLTQNNNSINDMEGYFSDIGTGIDYFWLNTYTSETKWDNVYFESSAGSAVIAGPSGSKDAMFSKIGNSFEDVRKLNFETFRKKIEEK